MSNGILLELAASKDTESTLGRSIIKRLKKIAMHLKKFSLNKCHL